VSADADTPAGPWAELVGSEVVVDTDTGFVIIGKLEASRAGSLSLSEADVHDIRDSSVTKEVYALEAMKYGVRSNRRRVHVRMERVVCISRLEDVIRY
jgi:hypothetical protein